PILQTSGVYGAGCRVVVQNTERLPGSGRLALAFDARLAPARVEPAAVVEGVPMRVDHPPDRDRRVHADGEPGLVPGQPVEGDHEGRRISVDDRPKDVAGPGAALAAGR